ncbi:MAG: response regulator [Clostridiales bacterium]|nr:response regulator [Clostridiales bacterium]
MIRVLIVDDDKLARKGLISIMPWASHNMKVVGEAANGAKALEFLRENAVDLMFVDISMPVLSGIELIKESHKLYPNLQSVVLTFHEDFEYVQTTFRLGILDYISKAQLEMEDYDEIFDRIEKKLTTELRKEEVLKQDTKYEGNYRPAINPENFFNREKWNKVEQKWFSLSWLFSDADFQKLCAETAEIYIPVKYIEELFMRIALNIENTFHIKEDLTMNIESIHSAIEWIKHYRGFIYSQVSKSQKLSETPICILKAVLFIRNNLSTPISTEVVAEYVNMSRSYFCQSFKKYVGLTFNCFLRQERIRTAEQLLCQSKQSIGEIAVNVGYYDVKYFSQIFHSETGLLPSEFRLKFHNRDK